MCSLLPSMCAREARTLNATTLNYLEAYEFWLFYPAIDDHMPNFWVLIEEWKITAVSQ